MKESTAHIAVWDLPTRVFHWTLAASFTGAFFTADSERWRDVHVMLGYTLLGLVGFRLLWGFAGSHHARFSAFLTGPRAAAAYLRSLLSGQPAHFIGHNPAGGLAIVALLGLGAAASVTGIAALNELGGEWPAKLHEVAANAMLALVMVHVAAVVVSSALHRENLVAAMVTGRKTGAPADAIPNSYRVIGLLLLTAVAAFWIAYAPAT